MLMPADATAHLARLQHALRLEATDAIVSRHRATIADNVKIANEFFLRHQSSFAVAAHHACRQHRVPQAADRCKQTSACPVSCPQPLRVLHSSFDPCLSSCRVLCHEITSHVAVSTL